LPQEISAALKFSSNRLNEFCIGRHCARKALIEAGADQTPLLIAKNGSPTWPKNYVGSIAHTHNYTAAVISDVRQTCSIGIDTEELSNFPLEIKSDILRLDEVEQYLSNDLFSDQIKLALYFSIKEAVYKAYNPVFQEFLDFQDVKVELNVATSSYKAHVYQTQSLDKAKQKSFLIQGLYAVDSIRVYSSAWIR
jgi:4'-phosphopantetheinyl transferase EntD